MIHALAALLALILLPVMHASAAPCSALPHQQGAIPVSGSGVHLFSTAIVHETSPTPTGQVQRSTDTVELTGDLEGRILYHPTSVFDFAAGTLVNTGHQVFSGTVLGSDPVLLHDDQFRFEVDLATGATTGAVRLFETLAGPKVRCELTVVGTGMTAEGNATFDYSGTCRFRGADREAWPIEKVE